MSTQYAILNNIDEDNNLVFETDKTEEELEAIVDSYLSGSGNNFQFDDNYFQDPTTIENDFFVIKQMTVESPNFYVLYQFVFNYSEQSREDLLDYNFNLSEDAVSDILDQSFEIIKDDFTSSPISFDYDFKFCEGGND
jgi:hypothetical protein